VAGAHSKMLMVNYIGGKIENYFKKSEKNT